jgi:hypothetical protein
MFSSALRPEQHERRAVAGGHRIDGTPRRVNRPLPAVAVAHARRVVEQDRQFAVAAGRCKGRHAAREEGPRERPQRSMRSPPRASAAGTSGGCAAGAPTGTGIFWMNISDGNSMTRLRSR